MRQKINLTKGTSNYGLYDIESIHLESIFLNEQHYIDETVRNGYNDVYKERYNLNLRQMI